MKKIHAKFECIDALIFHLEEGGDLKVLNIPKNQEASSRLGFKGKQTIMKWSLFDPDSN